MRKPGRKESQGVPPAPPGIKPLAGARSIFCVCVFCNHLFLAHVHQTRFGYAYSGKNILLDLALQKIQPKKISQKKVPKSGHVHGSRKRPATVLLRLYPKRWSEQRAALKPGVHGSNSPGDCSIQSRRSHLSCQKPLVFFPPFLTGEMEAAGRHPPGALRPEAASEARPEGSVTHGGLTPPARRSGGPCWPASARRRRSTPRRRGSPG